MIQRYTCVPTFEYDVLIVTNGTPAQVEASLCDINSQTDNELPLTANVTYLDTFADLVEYLNSHNSGHNFSGKVLFMFFNGLAYIQDVLLDLIDHYHQVEFRNKVPGGRLSNAYFYFDSSILILSRFSPNEDSHEFNTIVTIANDILKKISFMVGRIRGVFIDDLPLAGEKGYPLHCLMRNFPHVERIELSSHSLVFMPDLIV